MKLSLLTTGIIGGAVAFAFREAVAGSPLFWLGLGIPYLLLAALAIYRLHDDGTLRDVLRPRAGDVTIGFFTGAILLGGAWAGHNLVQSSPNAMAWLFRLALQLGESRPSPAVLTLIAGIATLEELVWRGLVLSELTLRLGTRRAWPVAAVLYAVAHAPTLFTLSDPRSGPNPLVVLAALGAGIVWSFMASFLGRLPPVIISHATFSYFAAALFLPRFG